MSRYIKSDKCLYQINWLNCGDIDKWIDTCYTKYQPLESVEVDEDGYFIEEVYCEGINKYAKKRKLISSHTYININLNDQWRPLTYTSNALEDYTVYESFSNYHVGSGKAKMRITFRGIPSLTLKYRSDGETTFDYVILSKLDTAIRSSDISSSSTVQYNTRGSQGSWKTATYANDGEEHFIEVVYLKDGSIDTEPDRGFIAIPNIFFEDVGDDDVFITSNITKTVLLEEYSSDCIRTKEWRFIEYYWNSEEHKLIRKEEEFALGYDDEWYSTNNIRENEVDFVEDWRYITPTNENCEYEFSLEEMGLIQNKRYELWVRPIIDETYWINTNENKIEPIVHTDPNEGYFLVTAYYQSHSLAVTTYVCFDDVKNYNYPYDTWVGKTNWYFSGMMNDIHICGYGYNKVMIFDDLYQLILEGQHNTKNWNADIKTGILALPITSKFTSLEYLLSGLFWSSGAGEFNQVVFVNCKHWDTSNVTNMRYTFANTYVTSLDLKYFDTSKVTTMEGMFYECNYLETLNLDGWNLTNLEATTDMFKDCTALTTIYMRGCSQDTIDKIEAIKPSNATIIDYYE